MRASFAISGTHSDASPPLSVPAPEKIVADSRDKTVEGRFHEPFSTATSLIDLLKSGDPDAWRCMVSLYYPFVYRFCLRGGLPSHELPDATQEVFRAVATGISEFRRNRPGDTFRGWLRTITRNKVNDYWRRAPVEGRAAGGSDAHQRIVSVPESPPSGPDVEDLSETSRLVRKALELIRIEFEQTTWDAFWRTAVDGAPPALVAADLGISANAVYKAKSRVLRRLRETLGDLDD